MSDSHVHICEVCVAEDIDDPTPATVHCSDPTCDKFLCDEHSKLRHRVKANRGHVLHRLDETSLVHIPLSLMPRIICHTNLGHSEPPPLSTN